MAKLKMKCPACGKELSSLRCVAQHIAYIVQCCDMGFDINPWDCEQHREWLERNKISSSYQSVKSFLEKNEKHVKV